MTPTALPLAVTMGDPAGVGGEIALGAWRALRQTGPAFFVLDHPDRLAALGPAAAIADPDAAAGVFAERLPVLPLSRSVSAEPGRPAPEHAPMVLEAIERAVAVTREGRAGAVVTNPINKAALYDADFPFPGHTEFLAKLGGVDRSVMMLTAAGLRVVPVTIHIPLSDAPAALTAELIEETARITAAALVKDLGVENPRLAIAGLNPHAGEGGAMGREEIEIIAPAPKSWKQFSR